MIRTSYEVETKENFQALLWFFHRSLMKIEPPSRRNKPILVRIDVFLIKLSELFEIEL